MMKDPRLRSPNEKVRGNRPEWHKEPYFSPDSHVQEKRPPPPPPPPLPLRLLRSASPPPEVERSGRAMDGYWRGTSIERAEFNRRSRSPPFRQPAEWSQIDEEHPFRVRRPPRDAFIEGNGYLSRSPPSRRPVKWSHIDEELSHRERRPPRDALIEGGEKYNLSEYRNLYGDGNPSLKHFSGSASGSGPSGSRYGHEKHLQGTERSNFMPPQAVGTVLNSGRGVGSLPSSSQSGKLGMSREQEELRFLNNLPANKLSERVSYNEEDEPLGDVYDPKLVSSHSKEMRSLPSGVSKDSFHAFSQDSPHSYGFSRRQVKHNDFEGQDEYDEVFPSDFARDPPLRSNDHRSFRYDPLSSAGREHQEFNYYERDRREEGNTGYLSEYRQSQPNERGPYNSRVSSRPILSDSVADDTMVHYAESSHHNIRESNPRGHHSLHGQQLTNYRAAKSNILAAEADEEFFESRISNFRVKQSSDCERTFSRGDYGFGRDAGPLSHKERLKRFQMSESDPNMNRQDLSPRLRSKPDVLSGYEPTKIMLKRRHPSDEEMSRHNDRSTLLSGRLTSRQVQELSCREEQWTDENPGSSFSSKRLRFSNLQHRNTGRPYDGRIANRISSSDDWSSYHDGPGHMQRRAVDYYTTGDENMNIKNRLRPCPSNYRGSHTMDSTQDCYKSDRTWKRNLGNPYNEFPDDGNPLEDNDAPLKPDLPEDSDEFKQLVEHLFLQFYKRLNENTYTRRRYREQGNAGSLFCVVCARLSKEFMDTRSLVTHTFMCRKLGKRAHHLALNKAICVLMGWKRVIQLNGACVYDVLPENEALTLREDLILWPPLVIIHNSSILDNNSDELQVMTIEKMEAILRDLGFNSAKTKVRYGKPANQSIMTVKFLPTFSGLQEAEKLHKYYIENKRGREEYQKLKNDKRNIVSKESGGTQEENTEHLLYGYMGNAEDLAKLDFDTKKKSLVKSKKDIQAIADAPLKSE